MKAILITFIAILIIFVGLSVILAIQVAKEFMKDE